MKILNKTIIAEAARLVQDLLPPGWNVELTGTRLKFSSKEGRAGELAVTPVQKPEPRSVLRLLEQQPALIAAPYLSRTIRELLEASSVSYVDHTGNMRVVLDEPGLFITTQGAHTNPWPDARRLTLRGSKAASLVCTLARSTPPLGVRALATLAGADPGYVSRLLGFLDSEALIQRGRRGSVEQVHWRKLLRRWSEDAPLESRATATTWLAPRGLNQLWESLRADASLRYAITGSAAAATLAPVAPTRLASLYAEDSQALALTLGLRATSAGANVVLLQPDTTALFEQGEQRDGLRYATLPVVIADLLTGPGRSPAEAEALMDWMDAHEEVWRG
jgi:hypothetical protein